MPDPATIATIADDDAKDLRRRDQADLCEETTLVGSSDEIIEFPRHPSDDVLEPRLEAPPFQLKPLRLVSEQPSIAPSIAPHVAAPPDGTGDRRLQHRTPATES